MSRLEILVVDDEPALREVLSLRLRDWDHAVRAVSDVPTALREIENRQPDVVLCDVVLPGGSGLALLHAVRARDPRLPVVMITAHGNIDSAVEAMKCGATDFLTKPLDHQTLRAVLDNAARVIDNHRLRKELDGQLDVGEHAGIVGATRAMRELRRHVSVVAATDAAVLITGESGTGKEVVARAIHTLGARATRPFVAVNAAAIPEGLIESEIFGHEQGAFTGATRARPGCFELAQGGTLFLDEIAEMPAALQPKLLRLLEDGRVRRLGASRDIHFDVRVVAATNRDLTQAVREGRLREDLLYRLNVFELVVPPLRERVADVALLAQHFVRLFGRRHRMPVEGVAQPARELLESHPWPGNVRELRNVIERAVIVAREGWIEHRHLPPYLQALIPGSEPTLSIPAGSTLAEAERRMILGTLERVGDNKAEAARQLGVDVKTLRSKLRSYGARG